VSISATNPQIPPTRGRQVFFVLFALLFGSALGLGLLEIGLRYYVAYVQSREQMDPGFLVYDPQVGWQMARNWSGRHQHYDFDVHYTTNSQGLRGSWPVDGEPRESARFAFVGDSFTFGLGVNDDETFVQRLSKTNPAALYLNAGVAGYSTDQEYLYIKERMPRWHLDGMALVVYLANDLLDNTLTYPLQADMAKPLFVMGSVGELRLTNVPVPRQPKPAVERGHTLATLVLGEEAARAQMASWRNQWQLAQRLGFADVFGRRGLDEMPQRLAYPIDLFVRLAQEIRRLCDENHVSLSLILMPGRSYVELPDSLSAAFQDALRRGIVARQTELGVPVIDLATRLREEHAKSRRPLFHPNEGHLNVAGNQVVADLLRSVLPEMLEQRVNEGRDGRTLREDNEPAK
jgi:lysophospholipase L1-like esterase